MLAGDNKRIGTAAVGINVTTKILVEAKVLDPVRSWGCAWGYGPGDVGNTFPQQLAGTLPMELGEPGIVG